MVSPNCWDTLTRGWINRFPSYLLNPYIVFPSLALSTSSFDNAFTLFVISSACRGTLMSPKYSAPWLILYRKFPCRLIRTCSPHTQLTFLGPTILPDFGSAIIIASIIPDLPQSFHAVESHPAVWHSFRSAARRVWIALDLRRGGY